MRRLYASFLFDVVQRCLVDEAAAMRFFAKINRT